MNLTHPAKWFLRKAAQNLECASDAEAKAEALEIIGKYPAIEIWEGARLVEYLTAPSSQQ